MKDLTAHATKARIVNGLVCEISLRNFLMNHLGEDMKLKTAVILATTLFCANSVYAETVLSGAEKNVYRVPQDYDSQCAEMEISINQEIQSYSMAQGFASSPFSGNTVSTRYCRGNRQDRSCDYYCESTFSSQIPMYQFNFEPGVTRKGSNKKAECKNDLDVLNRRPDVLAAEILPDGFFNQNCYAYWVVIEKK
jgi:hypothetical protein